MSGRARIGTQIAAVFLALLALGLAPPPAGAARAAPPALVGVAATGEHALSLDELRAMPWTTVTTRNMFNDDMVAYRGPLMRDVLARLGLGAADSVFLLAANDYSVEIPTKDFRDWDVIVAMEADGAPLSPRVTGPLWLIYPQSEHRELDGFVYAQRLIWQLVRIEAR